MLKPKGFSSYIQAGFATTTGDTFATYNPSTGQAIAELVLATPDCVDQAVSTARQAQPGWAATPPAERAAILQRAASLLRENREALAALEVAETGRPISEIGPIDIETAAQGFEFFAAAILTLEGQYQDYPDGMAHFRREPLGVCAAIGAWNYPVQISAWKAAPALAAGNAVVLKPSELTPLSTLVLGELLTEAGLPDGVCNVVLGAAEVGQALVCHPDIDHVAMTGSIPTGKRILEAASSGVKITSLELGGKSPLLILDDADLDQAAYIAAQGNFLSNGEICGNTTRVFVPTELEAPFLERVRDVVSAICVGDPTDPSTHMGALISPEHRDKVHAFVTDAQKEGAKVVCGGRFASVPELPGGAFYEPTVLSGCRDTMRAVREEIFGPVMAVLTYDTLEEAVSRANDTPFGLCAAVASKDMGRAHQIARRLDAGTVWINTVLDLPVGFGYGGFKQSGIGYENGLQTLAGHMRTKGVYSGFTKIANPFI